MPSPPCSRIAFSSPAALAALRVVMTVKKPSRANFWAIAPPTPQRTPTGSWLSSTALPCASLVLRPSACHLDVAPTTTARSEEHTSELQSRGHLVCRLLLEKKKKK